MTKISPGRLRWLTQDWNDVNMSTATREFTKIRPEEIPLVLNELVELRKENGDLKQENWELKSRISCLTDEDDTHFCEFCEDDAN